MSEEQKSKLNATVAAGLTLATVAAAVYFLFIKDWRRQKENIKNVQTQNLASE